MQKLSMKINDPSKATPTTQPTTMTANVVPESPFDELSPTRAVPAPDKDDVGVEVVLAWLFVEDKTTEDVAVGSQMGLMLLGMTTLAHLVCA